MYRFLFLLQWICLIIFHSSSLASSAPSNRDAQTAQIDAFIEKILESDKFDLLADKIADRAAEKIKILQMRSIIKNGPVNGDSEKDLEETKEDYTTTETPTTEKYIGKPGNIDMQAAMEKFATIPEEKLSLKYQNFINGNFKASNDLSEEPITDKHHRTTRDIAMKKDKRYLEHDETTKHNVNSEPRVQHNKMYKGSGQYQNKHVSDRSSEKKSLKQSPKYNIDEEQPEKSVKTQNKDNSELIEYEVEMPSAEKEIIKSSQDNNQNDDLSRIFRTNEKKSLKLDKNQKETDETDAETSEENNVYDVNDKEIVQVDDIYETKEIKDEKSNVTTNITVRREGGKLFAFDPSPEYSEYHEKFAKLNKKVLKTNGNALPTTLLPK